MDTEDYHGYYQQGDAGMRILEAIAYALMCAVIMLVLVYLIVRGAGL